MKRAATASLMRSINRSSVLDFIRLNGPVSRVDVARQLNMSLPTVMRIVDGLLAEDFLKYEGNNGSTGGRPSSLVEVNRSAFAVVGIDLGGTMLYGTVADLAGTVQEEVWLPLNGENGQDAVDLVCELIGRLLDAPRPVGQRVRGVGIGVPGLTVAEEGIVTWAPEFSWRDLPLKRILRDRFSLPVFVENDVNLAALGELGFGAGRGLRNLVIIAAGTGVGAGIVVAGALYRGSNHGAGEIGYLPPGLGFLGRRYEQFGPLEQLISSTGIGLRGQLAYEAWHQAPPPERLTADDVFAAARRGEAWARQVVADTVDYLSIAVATVASLIDPEVIILGGEVARSADLLIEPILHRLEGALLLPVRLVASQLVQRAAVMGAITLVVQSTTEHAAVHHLP